MTTDNASEKPRFKKRVVFPMTFLVLLTLFCLGLWIRGNRVQVLSLPATPQDGIQCVIEENAPDEKAVHCAGVFDNPLLSIWQVLIDYQHFTKTFAHLRSLQAIPKSQTEWTLQGEAAITRFDHWPFELNLTHQQSTNVSLIQWESPASAKTKSRGFWKLTPLSPTQTRIEYQSFIHVSVCPGFLMRNILLYQIPKIIRSATANALTI